MELHVVAINIIIVFLGLFDVVSSTTCSYVTSTGVQKYTFCIQACCEVERRTVGNVCCSYVQHEGVYIGASMGAVLITAIFALCFTIIFCKRRLKLYRQAGMPGGGHRCTVHEIFTRRINRPHINIIPTVSFHVEPVLPPPYEMYPPPYSKEQKNTKQEHTPGLFPLESPPAYSPY